MENHNQIIGGTLEDEYESGSVGDELKLNFSEDEEMLFRDLNSSIPASVKDKVRGSVVRKTFHQSMHLKNVFDQEI
jgi:hypothetical protein